MARWHFRMLNDAGRNLAFKKAIQYWIRKECKLDVMDIGSGTGLLSMYAANVASVKNIYAVECSDIMAGLSSEVFKQNVRGKMVQLLTKHSTDVIVEEDLPSRVSLIVSETLDCGVFGEGILDTLIHAKQHLLEPDGAIVPWACHVFVTGYKSKSLCTSQILVSESFPEYLFLDHFRLVARSDEPYDAEYVQRIADFKRVTSSSEALRVDFNNLENMQKLFDGSIVKEFTLISTVTHDYLDGFVVWFKLFLNENDKTNVISTEPASDSCWPQAIFKLKERVLLKKNQALMLSMSCDDGVLKIHHELDVTESVDVEVEPEVLRFLNDDEFLRELEYVVSQHDKKFINCLDLSPFPYIGLVLLKDSRLEKLWCHKKHEDLVKKIASKNLISESSFVFIDDADFDPLMPFQLIILHPIHQLGDLDSHAIRNYSKCRKYLAEDGLMIPHKLTLYGELINSDCLVASCRITDVGVKRFKIDQLINQFATEVHLDLDNSLDCEKLTGIFKISEISFDDELHETSVVVNMRNINLPVHAIFFHHKIQLTESSPEISTNQKSKISCFKRSAQVLPNEMMLDATSVFVNFTQNSGIVKCDVLGVVVPS